MPSAYRSSWRSSSPSWRASVVPRSSRWSTRRRISSARLTSSSCCSFSPSRSRSATTSLPDSSVLWATRSNRSISSSPPRSSTFSWMSCSSSCSVWAWRVRAWRHCSHNSLPRCSVCGMWHGTCSSSSRMARNGVITTNVSRYCSTTGCRWACSSLSRLSVSSCCRVPTTPWERSMWHRSRQRYVSNISLHVSLRISVWQWLPIAVRTSGRSASTACAGASGQP